MALCAFPLRRINSAPWSRCKAYTAATGPCESALRHLRLGKLIVRRLPLRNMYRPWSNLEQIPPVRSRPARRRRSPDDGPGWCCYPRPMGWGMQPFYGQGPPFNPMQPMNQFTDPNNTTVFVGGLSGYVTEDELRSFFQGFGEITYVKIPSARAAASCSLSTVTLPRWRSTKCRAIPLATPASACPGSLTKQFRRRHPYRPAPPPPHYIPNAAPAGSSSTVARQFPLYGAQFGGNTPQGPPQGGMQVGQPSGATSCQLFPFPSLGPPLWALSWAPLRRPEFLSYICQLRSSTRARLCPWR